MEGDDDVMLRPNSLERRLRASTALQAVAAALLLAVPLAPLPAAAQLSPTAHPTGGAVVAGQANIGQNGNTTTIGQSSQRAAVNWNSFDVGSQSTVQFQQPNANAVTLNRVVGSNPSEIAGKIQANGQLVIVNQAGLVFDKGSQINAAGIVVSAAGISNSNFMAGKMVFDQAANAGAKIENRGTITVNEEGLAALVAPRVRNAGKIQAKMGTVILAGAEAETLDLYGDGLVSINVTKQVASAPDGTKALVTNSGVIEAQGGRVVLTADAVDGVVQTLVDAGGRINANSTALRTGRVLITGAGGDVRVEGVVTAAGDQPGTSGGEIKVSGSNATIIGSHARISVGGQTGGGTVALGTTLHRARDGGTGTAAATSTTLVVHQGATISANAKTSGNGGRVVALASGSTTMAGTITAKGGAQDGNGGYVEVSGGTVSLPGHVDTTAPKGATGLLSLDPDNIWVSDTQPAGTTQNVSWFSPASLQTQNTNIDLLAAGNLNVATSYNTTNTLNLGQYSLLLVGGTGLTIDHGFSISASGINLYTQAGPITLDGASGVTGGIITAAQLAAIPTPTTITMPAGNTLVMSGDGGIALGAAIIGSSGVPINEVDFYTNAGGISQASTGAIYASTVRAGTVVGDVNLLGTGNQIGNVPIFQVTSGDFSLVDSSALNATLLGGNNVFVQVTGGNALTLTTAAQISTGSSSAGRVSLVADALDVPRSATVTAGTVEIAPSTVGVPMSVLPTTPPANTLVVNAELLSRLSTTTLRLGGYTDVPGGTAAIIPTSGSINIASTFNLTGLATTLDLESVGPVTQNAPLTVNTLTGNAGVVTLTDGGNDIPNLGSFTATSFTLIDPNVTSALNVIGPVTAPTVSLTAPGIDIASVIDAATSTTLIANGPGGAITEGGVGVIDTGLLTGSANGGVTLDGANNIAQLGAFAPGGNFLLDNGANALAIVGAFSGAGDTMTLNAGNISQSAAGVITAATLTGSATNVNLATANGGNQIGTLGNFPVSGGNFLLSDGVALAVDGTASANDIYLQVLNGQGLTLASTAALDTSLSSGLVTLVTDLLSAQTGASITGATVEIAPNTTGLAVSLAPSSAPAGTLAIDQAALSAIDTTTLRIGAFTNSPVGAVTYGSPTAGSINIASSLDLNGIASILDLETTGAVTQNGPLVVNELTGRAGPLTLTTAGNDISYLGAFTAGGPFTLDNGANPLEIIGAFSGAGQTLTLNTGALSQSGAGIVTAGELSGSADGVNLGTASGGNNIATLGAFAPGGNFTLNNGANPLEVVGAFSGAGDGLTLNTGQLSQSAAGVVTAGTLTGTATGVNLSTATNAITNLGPFTALDGFSLTDSTGALTVVGALDGGPAVALVNTGGALAIDAPINATGTVALDAIGITQTAAGVITTVTLTGNAGVGSAALSSAKNLVTNLGPFGAGGAFALLDGTPLTVIGNVSAGSNAAIAVTGAGNSLTVNPGVTVQSGSVVSLNAATAIIQSGVVTGNAVTEVAAGDIDHAGNSIAGAGNVSLTAGGAINQSAAGGLGTIEATGGSVTLVANAITQQSGAQILDPTAGQTISLTSANGIAFAGTIAAASPGNLGNPTGNVSLTATNGDITETENGSHTGVLSALNLTGSAPGGSVLMDAPSSTGTANQVANLGAFNASGGFTLIDGHDLTLNGNLTAGTVVTLGVNGSGNGLTVPSGILIKAGTSAFLSTAMGNLVDGGTITAPNIALSAPLGTATVSGTLAGVVPDPTLDPLHKLASGTFPADPTVGAWITGGNIVLGQGFSITGAGGGQSQLVLDLTGTNGLVNLGNFNSTSTNLYLDLGVGRAAGQIAVRALQVQYTQPGTSQLIDLTGTVDGYSGYIAAAVSFIYPKENNNYRLNGCPIGATNCLFALGQGQVPVFFGIPSFLFPYINPLKDLDVDSPDEEDDILIILPDVGERDY
jgi:filamentous hemagglutinin family protein